MDQVRAEDSLPHRASMPEEDLIAQVQGLSSPTQAQRDECFRAVFEGSTQIVFSFGLDRRIMYVSSRWAETLGYDQNEVVGWHTSDLIHPDDYAFAQAQTQAAILGQKMCAPFELRTLHHDGNYRYYAASVSVIRDERGAPKYFVGIGHDVTDRRLAEVALARSEALCRAVNRCSQVLVSAAELESALAKCLRIISEHMDMDFAVAVQASLNHDTNTIEPKLQAQYHREGCSVRTIPADAFWDSGLDRWRDELDQGGVVQILTSEIDQSHRSVFEELGLKSFLAAAIDLDGARWGLICLCDHRRDVRWAESELAAVGSLANCIGAFISRIEAQKAYADSQQTLASLIAESPIGVSLTDSNWNVLLHNEAYCRLRGHPLEGGEERDFIAVTAPESVEASLNAHLEVIKHGRCKPFEKEYIWPDGTRVPVLVHSVRLAGIDDRYASFLVDLTESRNTLEALRQSEQFHRSIIENSTDIIFTLSPQGVFQFISPAWRTVAGYDPQEAIGQSIRSIVHPDDIATCLGNLQALTNKTRTSAPLEYRAMHGDGTWHTFSTKAGMVLDAEGNLIQFVGIATDTTERVRAEQRLTALTEELTHANADLIKARDEALSAARAKGQFLANMSHEIRTPLNGVLGMANLLRRHLVAPDALEILSTIESSGETLLRVIDDILVFSKIDAGRLEIQSGPVTLSKLTADVAALYQAQAKEQGITLLHEGPTESTTVLLDPVRMRQVLGNLVSNAVKFTRQGQVVLKWDIAEAESGIVVRFSIADTGIGIPSDRIAAIFDSFTQADASTERQYGGSGLGLAISSRLIALMGGQIRVQSEEGVGSTFFVELPTSEVKPNSSTLNHKPTPAVAKRFGFHVLLAEDNLVNRKVATMMLQRFGCEVLHATDGNEAIAMATEHAFDLILMDVQMPLCDGLSATRAIRAMSTVLADLPIYALTANAMREDQDACIEAGMSGFLAKPFTPSQLLEVLSMVESHRIQNAA